jgi:hypothetical protein
MKDPSEKIFEMISELIKDTAFEMISELIKDTAKENTPIHELNVNFSKEINIKNRRPKQINIQITLSE